MVTKKADAVRFSIVLVFFLVTSAEADEFRNWRHQDGREARLSFVAVDGEWVCLLMENGHTGKVRMVSLSAEDQAYIQSLEQSHTSANLASTASWLTLTWRAGQVLFMSFQPPELTLPSGDEANDNASIARDISRLYEDSMDKYANLLEDASMNSEGWKEALSTGPQFNADENVIYWDITPPQGQTLDDKGKSLLKLVVQDLLGNHGGLTDQLIQPYLSSFDIRVHSDSPPPQESCPCESKVRTCKSFTCVRHAWFGRRRFCCGYRPYHLIAARRCCRLLVCRW